MKTVNRLIYLDTLRGIAILLMFVFHIIVDLTEFYGYGIDYLSGFWYLEGKTSAVLFMAIAGASAVINRRTVRHGMIVLGCGLTVTIATYLFDPSVYVRFGILQLIGVSILSVRFLLHIQLRLLPLLALTCFMTGHLTAQLTTTYSWLLPFGITPPDFASMDYYPLLPWYGVFVLGAWLARIFDLPARAAAARLKPAPDNHLAAAGRHSLLIYLAHQPLLLGLLGLLRLFQVV